MFTLRLVLLLAITLDLAMMAVRVWRYRPLFDQPGGLGYMLEPAVVLTVYAVLIAWATTSADPVRRTPAPLSVNQDVPHPRNISSYMK
jgi:hypothetical protein